MQLHMNRPNSVLVDMLHSSDTAQAAANNAGRVHRPTLRLKELLALLQVSRSKAYELMKADPDFPKSIPVYDAELSPRFYWTHEAIAWLEGRAQKFRSGQKDN